MGGLQEIHWIHEIVSMIVNMSLQMYTSLGRESLAFFSYQIICDTTG
jgi:hypothetical protein